MLGKPSSVPDSCHTCTLVCTGNSLHPIDKDKGGHFTISPIQKEHLTTKQQYLPSNNILQTRYLHEDGVVNLLDFFARPFKSEGLDVNLDEIKGYERVLNGSQGVFKRWLVRRVECVRGAVEVDIQVCPAFNYAQDEHTTDIINNGHGQDTTHGQCHQTVIFKSKSLSLQLNTTMECGDNPEAFCPKVTFQKKQKMGHAALGEGVFARITLQEGQAVSFVMRDLDDPHKQRITSTMVDAVERETSTFWFNWISQSKYTGRWREVVNRSLMLLKMLTYEPTGAIIAAPTFSLPEDFGGSRNWDYRFCWVRDSSFVIYILLRMGFKDEAEAYMSFISDRMRLSRNPNGGLPIMFSVRGETDLPEIELSHLDGYRGSKPVRIGNGAAFHKQLDIYGELMDAIYLYNKLGKPISYDEWVAVRSLTDFVCGVWHETDMSIWEVRGQKQQFVYSKMMLWVALDRALRLADKRCFPCPRRIEWLKVRDTIYDDVMEKGYNQKMQCFIQSYEANEMLDSAVLIAPLVFFIAPNDPRFTSTLEHILRPLEKGGLTSAGLVYRYSTSKSDDGTYCVLRRNCSG